MLTNFYPWLYSHGCHGHPKASLEKPPWYRGLEPLLPYDDLKQPDDEQVPGH